MIVAMDVSFFYVGRNDNYDDFIMPKIGETGRALRERQSEIRADGYPSFEMLGWLYLINVTQAQRRHIESEVRAKMEKFGQNIKNDHFLVPVNKKKNRDAQYNAFALIALGYAMDCCKREGYRYTLKLF